MDSKSMLDMNTEDYYEDRVLVISFNYIDIHPNDQELGKLIRRARLDKDKVLKQIKEDASK
jgi:hypothetical protein